MGEQFQIAISRAMLVNNVVQAYFKLFAAHGVPPQAPAEAQLVNQLTTRPMHPRFYRPHGTSHRLGNLPVTQFIFVKQNERLAIFGPDVGQSPLDFFGQMPQGLGRRRTILDLLDFAGTSRAAGPRRQQRSAAIPGDRQQPREKISLTVPAPQATQGTHKRLLGHVLRIFVLSQHPVAQGEDPRMKPPHQGHHGQAVSTETRGTKSLTCSADGSRSAGMAQTFA